MIHEHMAERTEVSARQHTFTSRFGRRASTSLHRRPIPGHMYQRYRHTAIALVHDPVPRLAYGGQDWLFNFEPSVAEGLARRFEGTGTPIYDWLVSPA